MSASRGVSKSVLFHTEDGGPQTSGTQLPRSPHMSSSSLLLRCHDTKLLSRCSSAPCRDDFKAEQKQLFLTTRCVDRPRSCAVLEPPSSAWKTGRRTSGQDWHDVDRRQRGRLQRQQAGVRGWSQVRGERDGEHSTRHRDRPSGSS